MWWNLDRAGRPDDRLLHCGEPVQTFTPIPQRSNEPRTWLRGSMAQRAPFFATAYELPPRALARRPCAAGQEDRASRGLCFEGVGGSGAPVAGPRCAVLVHCAPNDHGLLGGPVRIRALARVCAHACLRVHACAREIVQVEEGHDKWALNIWFRERPAPAAPDQVTVRPSEEVL